MTIVQMAKIKLVEILVARECRGKIELTLPSIILVAEGDRRNVRVTEKSVD